MSAFETTSRVEEAAWQELTPFLDEKFPGWFRPKGKGPLAIFLQYEVGDALANEQGEVVSLELKAEEECGHGNLFLETWSNRRRRVKGWLHKSRSTKLLYYFRKEKTLYMAEMRRVQEWAFQARRQNGESGRIYDFPEREQGKYQQHNDTWGRCVPIAVLQREAGLMSHDVSPYFQEVFADVAEDRHVEIPF